ncbi:MAG: peptide-methionine (S)-S-oxide reductase MsrA [Patescibacteria group bacterium]
MNNLDDSKKKEIAIFGGGCFWCTEAVFKMLRGVLSVEPGYAGGDVPNSTYEQVSNGNTGAAEVIKIEYDPAVVNYRDLLTVFFGSHDPTSLNKQGNDIGTEYRSVIFYTTSEQKRVADDFIKEINASNSTGAQVVTTVEALGGPENFYPAEDYHKDYYAKNAGSNAYCELVINPKLEKVKKNYAALLDKIYE